MVSRRSFLRKGITGGALLLLGATVPLAFWRKPRRGTPPRAPLRLLDADEHAILAAIAARVVPGENAGATWPSAAEVDCAGAIDALIARLHPDAGRDFKRLLRLFENGVGGLLTVGSPTPFTHLSTSARDAVVPYGGFPLGTRALQLPDSLVASRFLDSFGRPERAQTCSCERSQDASVGQALHHGVHRANERLHVLDRHHAADQTQHARRLLRPRIA